MAFIFNGSTYLHVFQQFDITSLNSVGQTEGRKKYFLCADLNNLKINYLDATNNSMKLRINSKLRDASQSGIKWNCIVFTTKDFFILINQT